MLSNRTGDLLAALESVATPTELWSNAARYLDGFGFTHSVYTFINPRDPGSSRVWTSLPAYWGERYADQKYWDIDPFYRHCCNSFAPMMTGPDYLDDYDFLTEPERQVVREGGETGFRAGFSAPVRLAGNGSFGGWNFGSRLRRQEMEALLRTHGRDLRLAAFYIHEHAERLARPDGAGSPGFESLTRRERECLLWLSRGLRTAAIADRMSIAQVTVDLHLKGARRKLNAATREEALAKAILLGLVHP